MSPTCTSSLIMASAPKFAKISLDLPYSCTSTTTTSVTMAKLLSGKDASAEIRSSLAAEVTATRSAVDPSFRPGLAIVQVGGREDSNVYIRMKLKAAAECGIDAQHVQLPR